MRGELVHAARLLTRLPQHTGPGREGELARPADGSPAAREVAALAVGQAVYLEDLLSTANLRLTVAEEMLASIGRLIQLDTVFFSAYPLIRSVGELGARVGWLLDETLSGPQRVSRALGDRVDSLREQAQLPVAELRAEAKARRRQVISKAASVGVTGEKPPGNTNAVATAWGDDAPDLDPEDRDLGRLTYKLLAATTHGTIYALMRHISAVTFV